jgi:serine protease AprX
MRLNRASNNDDRSNALWGRGSRGESRSNALWGRGGRRAGSAIASFAVVCAFAASATAAGAGSTGNGKSFGNLKSYVAPSLLSSIQQNPKQSFDVIVQGDRKGKSHGFIQKILQDKSGSADENVGASQVKHEFLSLDGARLTLTGKQILRLAKVGLAQAIQPNETVKMSAVGDVAYSNDQLWPYSVGAPVNWTSSTATMPTIAIVDSGIDASRADFGGRVTGQVDLTNSSTNSPGDGYGHGTFVAGIAAGAAAGHAGVAPTANLVSLDIMDDTGAATVSNVLAACDWILQNKDTYDIRVANFSLHAANRASIFFDPLDQAVEKLWLNGVVVVTASGNYGVDGQAGEVSFAPGNDPFVITVGAADIMDTPDTSDDVAAPWSTWGHTADGFAKPELSAPGRYMVGPVPSGAGLALERADHVVADGYMQLSGTSFASPAVAGMAASLLGQHPNWTPDQVKGALMVSADPTPAATSGSLGIGEADMAKAAALVSDPPNPNAGLTPFVVTGADGTPVLDAAAWQSAASSDAAWASAAWSDAAWSDAAWSDAAWASAAWSDAAWSDAAWSDAAWSDAAWASAAWSDAAWSDAAWSDAAWADAAWADSSKADPAIGISPTAVSPATKKALLRRLGLLGSSSTSTLLP